MNDAGGLNGVQLGQGLFKLIELQHTFAVVTGMGKPYDLLPLSAVSLGNFIVQHM